MSPLSRLSSANVSPHSGPAGASMRSSLRAGLVLLLAGSGCVFVSKDDIAARKDQDGDGVAFDEDCNDNNSTIGAPEEWYVDEDNDSFGTGELQSGCEPPARIADNGDDCDDTDPLVNPAAAEVYYNDKDDDCAGVDANGDGAEDDKDKDSDGATVDVDCDDEDPTRFPDDSIPEVYYNGLDDDCNLETADGDQDGDSYWHVDYENLVISSGERPMSIPDGDLPGDCWDDPSETQDSLLEPLAASDVNPGAPETHYDGIDQDCAGEDADRNGVDDDFDQDGDGFASAAYPDADGERGEDCLDCLDEACRTAAGEIEDPAGLTAANVNPDATDVWYDGTDADCDGANDYDFDEDGDPVPAGGGGDCNDEDPLSHTGASDVWYDGVDRDCAGNSDYDVDGDFWVPDAYAGRTTTNAPGARQDGSGDCWDNPSSSVSFPVTTVDGATTYTAADFNPGATDAWYDGVDLDCAGNVDFDADGDGYSSDSEPNYTGGLGQDCDDSLSAVNPDATEVCSDGIDNDCSGHSAPCGVSGVMSISQAHGALYDPDNSSSGFGYALDAAHDIDGDGTMDLVASDPYDSTYGASLGTVTIYSGAPSGFADATRASEAQLYGYTAGEGTGLDLTGVSDLNGDGYDDVAVGIPYNDDAASNGGLVAFVYGPVTASGPLKMTGAADGGILGTETSGYFGQSLAAGDLTNSGSEDLLVASPYSDWNGTSSGRLFLVSGPSSVSYDTDHTTIEGVDERTYSGRMLEVEDLSGDGVPDLIAGYEYAYYGSTSYSVGQVAVLEGPLSTTSSYDLGSDGDSFIYGSDSGAALGSSAAVADLDDDGYPDLALGARYGEGPSGNYTGAAYVYFGPLTTRQTEEDADLVVSTSVVPTAYYPQIGSSLGGGDIDGDGKDDLVVGGDYAGPTGAGAIFTFHGPLTAGGLDVTAADGTVMATSSYSQFGWAMSIGDTSGDGIDDINVSQLYNNGRGYNDGQVLVFTGGAE